MGRRSERPAAGWRRRSWCSPSPADDHLETVRARRSRGIPQDRNIYAAPVRGRTEPYVAATLRNDVDPIKLAARLAAIAADPDWPDALRAEAHAAAESGLDVDDLTDSTIITALNAGIVSRAGKVHAGGHANTVSGRRQP